MVAPCAFCRSAMLSASLPHLTSQVKNGKNISSVDTKRDVVCQSTIEGCNFQSCSEVNADGLSPTAKSGCGGGPLTSGNGFDPAFIDCFNQVFELCCSAKVANLAEGTRRGVRSRIALASFLLRTLWQTLVNRLSLKRES